MGFLMKLYNVILFFFFLAIALIVPLINAQTCLPLDYFPTILIDLRSWYANEYGDYFFLEKPHFFVGLVWVELLLQWPLAVASLYAVVTGKSWLCTTSLIYGASAFTSVVTILMEMTRTGKASENLQKIYVPYLVCTILSLLRGLLPHSAGKGYGIGKRPALNKKKRA